MTSPERPAICHIPHPDLPDEKCFIRHHSSTSATDPYLEHGTISAEGQLINWYNSPRPYNPFEGFVILMLNPYKPRIHCRGRGCYWRIPVVNGDLELTLLAAAEHRAECGKYVRPRKTPVDLPFTLTPKESNEQVASVQEISAGEGS